MRATPEHVVAAAAAALVGKACCLCRVALNDTDEAVVCPRCGAVHHATCWQENGGCGRMGCPQTAITLRPNAPARTAELPRPSGWQALPIWPKVLLMAALVTLLAYIGVSVRHSRLESAAARVRLTALVPADLFEEGRYQKLAAQFEAEHPGVRVTVNLSPYRGYEQKLLITTGAGDPPDLFMLAPSRAPFYADHGALLPLEGSWRQLPDPVRNRWEPLQWTLGPHLYGLARGLGWPAVWVISSQTAHPDLAWQLLVHFLEATSKDGKPPKGFTLEPQLLPDLWGLQ